MPAPCPSIRRTPTLATLALGALALAWPISPLSAEPGRRFPELNAEQLASIQAALPAQARAKPAKPRKLLIFYRTEGYVHDSIPFANETLKRLGESTGAYSGVISDDMAMFDAATLNTFDGVIFVSTTGLKFANPAQRKALLDFAAAGKGVMGLHAATDNFPGWPEGQALIGGVFHGHPWGAGDTVAVKLDDPSHVVNTAFEGRGFWVKEEIYRMKAPYSREQQRVLLSLDMSHPENARGPDKLSPGETDFPISWIKTSGRSRVFYSSLGHNKDIFYVPAILQHFLDGIQYALGDLTADAMPSARLPKTPAPALAPDSTPTLQELAAIRLRTLTKITDETYAQLAAFDGNKPPVALGTLETALRARSAAQRQTEEPRLLAVLGDQNAPVPARQSVLQILAWASTASAVPALEKAAAEPALAHEASAALAAIGDPSAETALVRLLSAGTPATRACAINALGRRQELGAQALAALKTAAQDASPAIADAALEALARRDTPESFEALRSLSRKAASPTRTQALLDASQRITGSPASPAPLKLDAAGAAREIFGATKFSPHRVQAARILLAAGGGRALSILLPLARDSDPLVRRAIVDSLITSGQAEAHKTLLAGFAELAPDSQRIILAYVEQSGRADLLPFALAGLKSADSETRGLAIRAAGRAGDDTTLATLLPLLANTEDAASATLAIGYLPTGKVDVSLRARLASAANPGTKADLLKIIANRQDRETFSQAVDFTREEDKALRTAAFSAVATLVRPGDLERVLALHPMIKTGENRKDWRKAVFICAGIHPVPADAVRLIGSSLDKVAATERTILIGALTSISGVEATQAIAGLLAQPDPDARKEVIRSLSAARTQGSFNLLLATAQKALASSSERILALRGYLDTVESLNLNNQQRDRAYRDAWPLADRQEDKDAIIAAVKEKKNKESEKFLQEFGPSEAKSDAQT